MEKREKQAARRQEKRAKEKAESAEDGEYGDEETKKDEETEATALEQAARAGKVVECRARAVGANDREGRHPDSLDVDALVGDILKTVAAFEAEEARVVAERAE